MNKRGLSCAVACALFTAGVIGVGCVGDSATDSGSQTDAGNGDGGVANVDGATGADSGSPVDGSASDGATDTDGGGDGGEAGTLAIWDGPGCTASNPFNTPVLLPNVNSAESETTARISANGLELFVYESLAAGGDNGVIKRYTRNTTVAPWTFAENDTGLGNLADGGATKPTSVTLTPDGLTGYVSAYPLPINGNQRTYYTTRTDAGASAWTPLVMIDNLAGSSGTDEMASLSTDGNTLYFMSGRSGTFQVWSAARTSPTTFTVNGQVFTAPPAESRYPVLTKDELTMYIGQFGVIDGGAAYMSVYVATRGTKASLFGAASYVKELSITAFTSPTWLSPNGCYMLLASNRAGSQSYDIYYAQKP